MGAPTSVGGRGWAALHGKQGGGKEWESRLTSPLQVRFQVEVADQAVQILGVDAEGAGGVRITAGGLAERGEDQFLLGVVEDR